MNKTAAVALVLASVCFVFGCQKKRDDAGGGQTVEKTPTATNVVSGEATFEDDKVKGMKVAFKSGRTFVGNSGLMVELSDQEMTCEGAADGAFTISIDVPEPPGGVTQPITFGTFVSSLARRLHDQVLAKPDDATLTLTAFSKKAGERIKGTFEFHRAPDADGWKYDGKGSIDVAVCPDGSGMFKLADVVSFPAAGLGGARVEGTVQGKPFVAKTVLAKNWFGELHLGLYDGDTSCETQDDDEKKMKFLSIAYVGVDEHHNASGALHPIAVGVGANSWSEIYTASPGGWVKLDKTQWPLPKTISGALVIASGRSDKTEDAVNLGGKFTATVCP